MLLLCYDGRACRESSCGCGWFPGNNIVPGNADLSGIAREYYELYQVIHEGTGLEARVINGSGNGLRKNLFLQKAISDMFKAPLILTDLQEEGASGAALSAALYLHESAGR